MAKVHEKTISLTGLIPENYRLWASQSEATFRVYGVLDIVLGHDPSPERAASSTPSDTPGDADVVERPITAAQRKSIEQWQQRHDLARQALLACLQAEELTKVYNLQRSGKDWQKNMALYQISSVHKPVLPSTLFKSNPQRLCNSISMPSPSCNKKSTIIVIHRSPISMSISNSSSHLGHLGKLFSNRWHPAFTL
jgi:hypothetical protein